VDKNEIIRICEEIEIKNHSIKYEEAELLVYIEAPITEGQFCVCYEDFHPHLEENYLHINEGSQWYPVDIEDIESIYFEVSHF